MSIPEFVKGEKLSLKDHPELNEKWVQDRIFEEPSILGLGDLIVKDRERQQPKAGRLDLLLQDPDDPIRYEVEIQLGKTDASHIIRTIEYWDIEKKRFPQYEHKAVIEAEDITGRFSNVINLFNGNIPLIALQMNALKFKDFISLAFTTVIDELVLAPEEEDVEQEQTDRNYWLNRGTKQTVEMADRILEVISSFAPNQNLKYNKYYIGLSSNGRANNFVIFKPKKKFLRIEPKLEESDEVQEIIEGAGIDSDYNKWRRRYRIKITPKDLKDNAEVITTILKRAYELNQG